jgi:hypothetical protein
MHSWQLTHGFKKRDFEEIQTKFSVAKLAKLKTRTIKQDSGKSRTKRNWRRSMEENNQLLDGSTKVRTAEMAQPSAVEHLNSQVKFK